MYRRYTLDEVKRRIVRTLQNAGGSGLSGIEIAHKTGINRMTVTKYLDVIHAMGLVGKKKIGNVNVWFLESGVGEVEFPVNYAQTQQKLIEAVLAGDEDHARRLLLGTLGPASDPIKIITDVIMPAANTINELYNFGRINRSERSFLLNIALEFPSLIKFNVQPSDDRQDSSVIVVAGSADRVQMAKCASVGLAIMGWNSKYLGNVEDEIDPFFDIDLQRFVSRAWADRGGTLVICIFSTGEGSLRFLSSTVKALKGRLKGELKIVIQTLPELAAVAEENGDFVARDLAALFEWCNSQRSAS